ncbi:NAD(P)-binding protein [Exidia glandulosa HHB12029]|uniref:NAD(P)-binding protein n=1 Tax=Exidia glandulosa HHB12029 TaxID=1314781 RepID=A0A165DBU2_EXIGL|nr:NAD(P)-binding protein [Exidia glandulosa HHB12029]
MPVALTAVQASNAQYAPSFRPVIVVFGGTSGIGAGIVRAFATHIPPHTGAHIVVVGRSKPAADALIASLPSNSNSQYDFVRVDALLVHDLRVFIRQELFGTLGLKKINYLVLSQGELKLDSTARTSEGFHPTISLMMYGRARAALDLAPLLQAAAAAGEDARILSVAAAGTGGAINLDDVALDKMGSIALRGAMITYIDICVASLAQRFPDFAVTHVQPGFVKTGLARGLPWYLRPLWNFLEWAFAMTADESGERMMMILVDPASKKGAFAKDHHNQPVAPNKYFDETAREVVWKSIEQRSDL